VITRGVLHTHDVSSVVTPSKQEVLILVLFCFKTAHLFMVRCLSATPMIDGKRGRAFKSSFTGFVSTGSRLSSLSYAHEDAISLSCDSLRTLVKLVNVGDIPTTVQLTGHVLPDFALRQYEVLCLLAPSTAPTSSQPCCVIKVVSARDTEGLMELWQAEHHEHHKRIDLIFRPIGNNHYY
jgi:hypothetical protein